MRLTFSSMEEQAFFEIGRLKEISTDLQFSEYLESAKGRLLSHQVSGEEIRKEVIANYRIYSDRRSQQGFSPVSFIEAVYPGQEAPVIASATPAAQEVHLLK